MAVHLRNSPKCVTLLVVLEQFLSRWNELLTGGVCVDIMTDK